MSYLGSTKTINPQTQTLWETEEYWNDKIDQIVIVWVRDLGVKPKDNAPTTD